MIDSGQHLLAVQHRIMDGPDYEALRARIPGVYGSAPEAFIFQGEISSTRLDAYFTRMHPSTLRNYALDAAAGVALLNSHRHNELPLGYSIDGAFIDGDVPIAQAAFYTVPNLTLNGVNTSDIVRGIEVGIIRDLSVGFHGGEYTCSICASPLFGGECRHIPGLPYDGQIAFAWIQDAHLSEVSIVYDGATPGAAILKATQEADAGRLAPASARILEARYRVRLPGTNPIYRGVTIQEQGNMEYDFTEMRSLLGLTEEVDPTEGVRQAHALLTEQAETLRGQVQTLTDALSAERAQVQTLANELGAERNRVNALTAEAALGRAYRADLIEQAVAAGVRAYGNDFDVATYRTVLEVATIDVIKRMTADWTTVAGRLFGERVSSERGEEATRPTVTPADDRAYRV